MTIKRTVFKNLFILKHYCFVLQKLQNSYLSPISNLRIIFFSRINSPSVRQGQNNEHFATHETLYLHISFTPTPAALIQRCSGWKEAPNQLQTARAQQVRNTRAKQGCNKGVLCSQDRRVLKGAVSVGAVGQKATVQWTIWAAVEGLCQNKMMLRAGKRDVRKVTSWDWISQGSLSIWDLSKWTMKFSEVVDHSWQRKPQNTLCQHCRPPQESSGLATAAASAGSRGCRVPVVPGVPNGSVTAEFVTLQLVKGVLAVGVFSGLQHLGGQVSLLIKTPPAALLSLGSPRHLEQRQTSERQGEQLAHV